MEFPNNTASSNGHYAASYYSLFYRIAIDAYLRFSVIVNNIQSTVFGILILFPMTQAAAVPNPRYTLLKDPEFSYLSFKPSFSKDPKVKADSIYFADPSFQFASWRNRATAIRISGNFLQCTGNLSIALDELGAVYQMSANGATNLLTLLPTAGALIGAPAKELWVLFQLVPFAGILSMALSLGGNIVPRQVSDYTSLEDFSYSGMRGSVTSEKSRRHTGSTATVDSAVDETDLDISLAAEQFADQVHARALDTTGFSKTLKVAAGITLLLTCLLCILMACWLLQAGAIIVWWCTVSDVECLVTLVAYRCRQNIGPLYGMPSPSSHLYSRIGPQHRSVIRILSESLVRLNFASRPMHHGLFPPHERMKIRAMEPTMEPRVKRTSSTVPLFLMLNSVKSYFSSTD